MRTATHIGTWVVAALVAAGAPALARAGGKPAKAQAREQGQAGSSGGRVTSGAGISVRTVNGQTTVTYKGEEVFSGRTTGQVSALSSSVNGDECAAAFDGDKVLWESVSGAAERLKPGSGATPDGAERPKRKPAKPRRADA